METKSQKRLLKPPPSGAYFTKYEIFSPKMKKRFRGGVT